MRRVPNAISLMRAGAVIPVVVLLSSPDLVWWALGTFALASLSDALDGAVARRTGTATPAGAFLDPLADKVLILGTLIALLASDAVQTWPVALILGREALAVVLRSAGALRGVAIEASTYGKAKTVVQSIAVGALLLTLAAPGEEIQTFAAVALVTAVVLTVASGVDLLVRAPVILFSHREQVVASAR